MKVLVVVLALALSGCGSLMKLSGEARLGGGGSDAATVKRVAVFIRGCPAADIQPCEDKAERWLLASAVPYPDAMELIAQAKEAVARERAACEGLELCQ